MTSGTILAQLFDRVQLPALKPFRWKPISRRQTEEGAFTTPMYNTNFSLPACCGVFSGQYGRRCGAGRSPTRARRLAAVAITADAPGSRCAGAGTARRRPPGIPDLAHPDYGDRRDDPPGEMPVFGCVRVTPQVVVMHSKPARPASPTRWVYVHHHIKNTALKF